MNQQNTLTSNAAEATGSLRAFSDSSKQHLHAVRSQLTTGAAIEAELDSVLNQIWNEAAFLGCPAVAKFSRAILPVTQTSLGDHDDETVQAISQSLDALEALLEDPNSQPLINAAEEFSKSLGALEASDSQSHHAWRLTTQAWSSADDQATSDSEAADHTDADIYSNDAINGLEWCSREETWMVSQIAAAAEDLAKDFQHLRPAHQLMRILSGHQFFQQVDRACVVGLMPNANQLMVVDSCLHQRMRDQNVRNQMVRGYSCLVDPAGSLAQMRPGVLRVFADSQAVLDSFARQGKPAQRSIAYVAESGLRSGICLAVGRGEAVQGFLFMNSRLPDYFRDVMRDYGPLLSLFSLLGSVALDGAGFHADAEPHRDADHGVPYPSEVFSTNRCTGYLTTLLSKYSASECGVSVRISDDLCFLYPPASVLGALAEMMFRLGLIHAGQRSDVIVEIGLESEQIVFRTRQATENTAAIPETWRQERIDELTRRFRARPLQFGLSGDAAVLRIPFEPAFASGETIRYSVAY